MNSNFQHLTKQDRSDLQKSKTFEELTTVALRVLKRMHAKEQKKAHPKEIGMVSGPISTGGFRSHNANIAAFRKTIRRLEQKGHCIFSQMPFEKHMWRIMETPYFKNEIQLLTKFYRPIFESGFVTIVHFMWNWHTSFGANWERKETKRLHMKRNDLP